MSEDPRDQQLQIEIEGGRLVVSVGINLLIGSALECDQIDAGELVVTDYDVFAQEIAYKLEAEDDDGTTLIHQAFDRAAALAIEDGCDGVREASDEGDDNE